MTYESGYEIVVGVRLIPGQASPYIVSGTKLPRSKVLGEEDKRYSSLFAIESHRTLSQRQAFQGLLEVVRPFDKLRTPPVKPFEPEMILITVGEFAKSSDPGWDQDAVDDEQPQHTLQLPDYYLSKTPVTNAQYAAFVQATGHHLPERWLGGQPPTGKEDHPVVYVSWHDAMAYCHWLAEETGKPYRLPSEAEWERGAQGSNGHIFPWGSQGDEKRCSAAGGKRSATPVAGYAQEASSHNLLDMADNVWEWTQYICGVHPYDPKGGREDIRSGISRVLRGGSWYRNRWYARCTLRYGVYPDARYHYLGFRVAVSAGCP